MLYILHRSFQRLLPTINELLHEVEQRLCVRYLYNNFKSNHHRKLLKELIGKTIKSSYRYTWDKELTKVTTINEE